MIQLLLSPIHAGLYDVPMPGRVKDKNIKFAIPSEKVLQLLARKRK